jgi:glycosyltransferase involved in cell wall biosynthesis
MLAAGRRLCRQERFDVVWSTFKPGLCHHVARALAGQFDMHWVADFRDLPDQTRTNWRIRRTVAAEGRFVADADLLITTTDVLAAKLAARHGRQVEVIPNGFDPAEYPDAANSPPPSREKFIVAHFGTVYAHSRPVALLEALDELLAQGDIDANCFSVEMYDPGARVMPAMLAGRPCQKIVRLLPRLSTQQMRGRMFDCSVLLALISPAAGGPAPSKIFEYLPVDRPVLCTPGDRGFAEAVLAQTGAGAVAPTAAEAARLLRGWYRQWQTSGCARREARPEAIALYSRRRQARRLAELFDRLAGEDHASGR